jgi:hypothetical protein
MRTTIRMSTVSPTQMPTRYHQLKPSSRLEKRSQPAMSREQAASMRWIIF